MRVSAALAVVAALAAAVPACAAEVAVVSTLNIRPALDAMKAGFERRGADTLAFTSQGAAATTALIESGAGGDVVVGSRQMLERFAREGLVRRRSIADIARSSIGLAVRAGANRPNIATDEDLKRALLATPSIAYPDPAEGSMGGQYLAGLIRRWNLADRLKAKTVLTGGGRAAGDAVAAGKAAIALNQIAELMPTPGLDYAAPLPPALTGKIVLSAGVLAKAANPKGAARWIRYLSSSEAAGPIRAIGMEP